MLEESMAGRSKKKNRAVAVAPSAEALERFKKAGIAVGYDPDTMERLAARCQGRPLSARGSVKLTDPELVAAIDAQLVRVFEYFDDHTLAQMSGRDLLVGAGILIDKRQLLRGEPTAITKFLDMRHMDEVMEMFRKEAARRERLAVVDVTPEPAAVPAENAGNGGVP